MLSTASRRVISPVESSPSFSVKQVRGGSTSQVPGDEANWWMITLSDLTLLLLGFSVVWYAVNDRAQVKQQPPVVVEAVASKAPATVPPLRYGIQSEQWTKFKNEMQSLIIEAGLSKDVNVESTETDLLVSLRDTVPFASGRAELRNRALPVLEKVASLALSHPHVSLEISGHTDSRPIATKRFPSNWELSAARASRVARYLIERGVHPSRIAVQGYANQRPKLPDSNLRNRRANRRVEIRLMTQTATEPMDP